MSQTAQTAPRPGAPQRHEMPPEEVLLGRYRVLARRGTGGFGSVCTCWDLRLQRRVAIKRIALADGALTTPDEALAEARTICLLHHPNIVTLYDYESNGAYAYLVMEYVDGLNLGELLARVEGGRLTYEECAHVLASVARAISYAHENKTLHLDIKPTNIIIDRQGTVKLADFGMADLASVAGYGDAKGGTVGYMPPEQIRGELVDERADVFALAAVVWQALSGKSPFLANTPAASLKLIERGPSRSLAKDCPDLPGDVELALLRALSPSPADRPSDVLELADSILPYLGPEPNGAASLRELLDQAEKDDGSDEAYWASRRPPVSVRYPWLEGAFERAVVALATFATVRIALPALFDATGVTVASLAVTLAAAAWPPLGSAAAGLIAAAALAHTLPTPASFPLAAAVAVAVGVWWVRVGRREHLASAAVLLPCCLPSPLTGAAVAGFALDPAQAAVTGGFGYLLGTVFHLAASSGFAATTTAAGLIEAATIPAFWVLGAGAVICALVSSAVAMRGSVRAGVAGQALGLVCLAVSGVLVGSMENDGIWALPLGEHLVLAVLLFVLLCIATVLRGPLFEDQEGEDIS